MLEPIGTIAVTLPPAQIEEIAQRVAALVLERLHAPDHALLTTAQLAARLGVSRRTAQELIYPLGSAEIPSLMVGGRRRVEPAAVDAFVARQRSAT